MSEETRKGGQDAALLWLLATTLAPYWRSLLLALVLLIGTAALNVAPPYLLQQAIDGPIATGDRAGLWWLGGAYALIVLVLFALQYGQTYFLQQAGQRALADLRTRLFGRIMGQDQAFFGRYNVGDLVARLTSDIDTLNALLSNSVVTILSESATLIAHVVAPKKGLILPHDPTKQAGTQIGQGAPP
jgi:ATP-binding cassette, subfamily B, multidrug efflux pump